MATPNPISSQTGRGISKILKAIWSYDLIEGFKNGYRNREDNTVLPQGILIYPSKNVMTNTANRLGIRKGYTLDGAKSGINAPILGAYDYEMNTNEVRHLRSGFLTSAGNDGKLQYRYVDSTGAVTWRDLMTGLTNTKIRFTTFWDTTDLQTQMLFVMGDTNIYEWSGGVTTVDSVTANTITKQGAEFWAEKGFTSTGTVVINGTTYTYTGGSGSTTLTGVTPDPTGTAQGDIAHQGVITNTNASMSLTLGRNDLVETLNNQLYVAATNENNIYLSKQNNFKDFSSSSPRLPGDGNLFTLDATITGLITQEDNMYVSAGNSLWYQLTFTQGTDTLSGTVFETAGATRLKTGALQGALSQEFIFKDKNNVIFVTNEPTLSTIGRVEAILGTPQTTDISWPIINDFNSYDFTDGSGAYWKNFLLVAVPKEGLIRIYNQTDPKSQYWEAPQTIPVSRFSIIDGELYGHSYLTSDTYKLLDGYNDLGQPIAALAKFSFMQQGSRFKKKGFNLWYNEWYQTQNGNLVLGVQYDMDGKETDKSWILPQSKYFLRKDSASLGKVSLGKNPLGGELVTPQVPSLPPKFRWFKSMPTDPQYWEVSPSYSSNDLDFQWELLAFGPNSTNVTDVNSEITG